MSGECTRFAQLGVADRTCSHDWGSQVCYEAARMRPDIFKAVVGLCIPVSLRSYYFSRNAR